jgi:hypothetical protein
MPESEKAIYRRLNHLQHELIDRECQEFDRRIITARPGVRQYAGAPIKAPMNVDAKELTFNPLNLVRFLGQLRV